MSMYSKIKVFILVKTYPALSKTYDEVVCTAGLTEDGKWIRIYPIPFRLIDYDKRYHKYQWVEVNVSKSTKDFRPESFKVDYDYIEPQELVPPGKNWADRNQIILDNGPPVYNNLADLIKQSQSDDTSLGIVKPFKVLDFVAQPANRDWDPDTIRYIMQKHEQLLLFQNLESDLKIVKKVPYKFQYVFEDESGSRHQLMVEDWETGVLYWKMLEKYKSEMIAIEKVKEKYWNQFVNPKKELYFFMGTTLAHHKSVSPFIIIGVYSIPKRQDNLMGSLFDI